MNLKPLPKFTAVVHVQYDHQAIVQAAVALEYGAQGVFLIDHAGRHRDLLKTYSAVRQEFPDAWIGLNFLDLEPHAAHLLIETVPGADALWMDQMGDEDANLSGITAWRMFGGAAFKYQPRIGSNGFAARQAAAKLRATDVITTSGPATGKAATVEKLQEMREAVPYDLLALASGVTPQNVAQFAPLVDCFLVATGISHNFEEFDPAKVRAVADVLKA